MTLSLHDKKQLHLAHLRSGKVTTQDECPVCGSPLTKHDDVIIANDQPDKHKFYCPKCHYTDFRHVNAEPVV